MTNEIIFVKINFKFKHFYILLVGCNIVQHFIVILFYYFTLFYNILIMP